MRQEVARQLKEMQDNNVIHPSNSPWASPIVLACKKDGTLGTCVDYRKLNSATKLDIFPLPRIDDLLDQLGKSKYSSTLDLAAGFWQIRMNTRQKRKLPLSFRMDCMNFMFPLPRTLWTDKCPGSLPEGHAQGDQ